MKAQRTVALVSASPAELRVRLETVSRVVVIPPERLEQDLEVLEAADCAVVAAPARAALSILHRLHARMPALQVVLVAAADQRPQAERALRSAPGLEEVWMAAAEELGAERVERAAAATEQRRRYRDTRRRIAEELGTFEPQRRRRARTSDGYLATLLHVLPHPVLSVDDQGRVLSWNPAAEKFFGVTRGEAAGRDAVEVMSPAKPADLKRGLAEGSSAIHDLEVSFAPPNAVPRVAEVTVVPVNASGHRVRAVVLHDVTALRRTQGAVEETAEELAAHEARLQQTPAELGQVSGELQQRSQQLVDALAARGRFYAAMSHELRTPMNAIIGYNSLLLEEIYGPMSPKQHEAVGKSQRAAEHLLELLNDVLDLAKIEAGRIELLTARAHFPSFLADLADTLRPAALKRGSELRLESGERRHSVLTDPRRLRQILLNLLGNAIKFGEGKPVEIHWRELPEGGIRIEVRDHGRGIAQDDLSSIFDDFMQGEDRPEGGTGLGLPISRRLAEILGGSLTVTSEPGEGSTFRLTLPSELPVHGPRGGEGDA